MPHTSVSPVSPNATQNQTVYEQRQMHWLQLLATLTSGSPDVLSIALTGETDVAISRGHCKGTEPATLSE